MHEAFGAEQPSRVVIDLEKQKDQVKLTVTRDDFAEGSKVFDSIRQGLATRALQSQELPRGQPHAVRALV